jgi:hypothetical protein
MDGQLAFYKAPGQIDDKLIRWWTGSPYSHVELVVDGVWYSSSARDGGVRAKIITPRNDAWDYLNISVDAEWLNKVFNETKGQGYDYVNIVLTQVLPLGLERPDKWICSEWCAYALFGQKSKMNPGQLYNRVRNELCLL